MWPLELLLTTTAGGTEPSAELTSLGGYIDLYAALGPLERGAVHVAVTLLVATAVLGLLPDPGSRTVAKCRRSPVISLCVGVPIAAILAALTATGYLIVDTSFGAFFGIPMVILGFLALPSWAALGFVAVGRSIAARLGTDRVWVGVLLGGLASGLLALAPVAAVVVGGLVVALGTGAGTRVLLGFRGATDPRERAVPPANKV